MNRKIIKGFIELIISIVSLGTLFYLVIIAKQLSYILILQICFFILISCSSFLQSAKNIVDGLDESIEEIDKEIQYINKILEIPKKEKVCGYCGTKLDERDSFYCPFCGSILRD